MKVGHLWPFFFALFPIEVLADLIYVHGLVEWNLFVFGSSSFVHGYGGLAVSS